MIRRCSQCGGDLIEAENKYKCRSCGVVFDISELAELESKDGAYTAPPSPPRVQCVHCYEYEAQYMDPMRKYYCFKCGKYFTRDEYIIFINIKGEKAVPCPRCGSTNGDIENGIFYCYDCEYEG